MSAEQHVYEIEIAASVAAVWTAITDSAWTRRYFFGTEFVEPPQPGRPYRTVLPSGAPAVEGVVEEMTPPTAAAAGRFVVTWHIRYDAALAKEPPGRVEWTVSELAPERSRVRLVHSGLADSPLTSAEVEHGWVVLLERLRGVLETGQPAASTAA